MFASPAAEMSVLVSSVADGTRPAAAWGTSVTPGNNTYGSAATLIASSTTTDDAHGILVNINSVSISATARDCIVTIQVNGSDFISHLLGSCAGAYSTAQVGAGGVWYYFPVAIPAGASVAAKASVNSSDVTAIRAAVTLYRASRPDAVYVGSFVETFGAVTASSCGTSVTPGTTSDGAWTQLGTVTTPIRYWEVGMGVNDSTMTVNTHHCDIGIGDAGNKKIAIADAAVFLNAAESLGKMASGASRAAATGDIVYGRNQVGPAASDSGISMIAYGVGG